MSIDTHAVLLSPVTFEIGLDLVETLDAVVQGKHFFVLASLLHLRDALGEGVRDAVDGLEEHQVRVGQFVPVEVIPAPAGGAREDTVEVLEELGQADLPVVLGLAERLVLLVLVVQAGGDGVVDVVGLVGQAVQGGQGQGVDVVVPVDVVLGGRGQTEPTTQIQQDVGRLGDFDVSVFQDRRGEQGRVVRVSPVLLVDPGQESLDAFVGLVGHVDVGGSRGLERETDVFAAAGHAGPVDQTVGGLGHLLTLAGAGRHGGGGSRKVKVKAKDSTVSGGGEDSDVVRVRSDEWCEVGKVVEVNGRGRVGVECCSSRCNKKERMSH